MGNGTPRGSAVARWQARLDELVRRHRVPGASLAVLRHGAIVKMASGVLNVETGVEATTDSLFQLGSITKLYTTTLVMQLIEEGKLGLDEPMMAVLPELRLGDGEAAGQVTMRHLLTHTSGIQGDHFHDTGRGDDALARYVDSCAGLGFSHPVGATMSYCNTGFVIAGRVVERLTGATWDQALRARLVGPLGLLHTVTLPEEAIRFRVAHGHVVDKGEEQPRLASVSTLPRSVGPAGLICATAADLIGFARLHLEGGRAPNGTQVLSAATITSMQEPQVAVPDRWTLGSHWGLGWILFDWDGRRVYGHDGATLGQSAFLRVVPDARLAVALLTNGGNAQDLYQELFRELLAELCDLDMPRPLAPPPEPSPVDCLPFAGRYERVGARIELEAHDGSLAGRVTATGPLASLLDDPVEEVTLVPVAERVFATRSSDKRTWTPWVFYELPDGSPYLHMGARATPKVAGAAP